MKIVVTGGAGFIGSHIVRELVKQNHEVIVIDNLFSGKKENLSDVFQNITFVQGDITDSNLLKKEFVDVDVILHQAAIPSVARSVEDPLRSHNANVNGTLKILLAARDAKVKRVVCAGSSSVYGNTEELPKHEDMPTNPLSPYALQKVIGEKYAKQFSSLYNLDTVTLRYFNVFGPFQDKKSAYAAAIPLFVDAIKNNTSPIIFGDGLQSRDFTFVQNVVQANLLAAQCKKPLAGESMNIACGQRISLLALIKKINELLGKNITPIFKETRVGDVKHSLASIDKAQKLLGFNPLVSFDEGLKQAVEWYIRTE